LRLSEFNPFLGLNVCAARHHLANDAVQDLGFFFAASIFLFSVSGRSADPLRLQLYVSDPGFCAALKDEAHPLHFHWIAEMFSKN
jgi:hypothetical protein